MPGPRSMLPSCDPPGHLDQHAQADDGLMPAQIVAADRGRRVGLVAPDEPAGQQRGRASAPAAERAGRSSGGSDSIAR